MLIPFLIFISANSKLKVAELKCESFANPLNLDTTHPRLSWVVSADEPEQGQSGYRILVASNLGALKNNHGDLWDSSYRSSSETLDIPYQGKQMSSCTEAFWKVQVWDLNGHTSAWSEPARWTMGLLSQNDWKAKWIGANPAEPEKPSLYFRKVLTIKKPISRALCFVSGLGQYEMFLNGGKVGNDWITPGWTQYAKTVLADSYDIRDQLKTGANAIAIHVGNGMYNMSMDRRGGQQLNSLGPKKTICQLWIKYADGTQETMGTDQTWRYSPSPETYSGVYGGEDFDARLDQPEWKSPTFQDSSWSPVHLEAGPGGRLFGLTHANPPLHVMEIRSAKIQTQPKPNLLVLDLGQNAPYVPLITVRGQAGDSIKLIPAEVLHPDGTVNQETMRSGKLATYTLKGGNEETWHPSFWYIGSRYWQIEASNASGTAIDPKSILKSFKGLMVHADIKPVGTFKCSNDLFNKTQKLIWWAMKSNFASVISDCPHREKSGWLEEDHLVGKGLMYSFDMSTMFHKVIQDMTDTQISSGMVPTMAPEYFIYEGGFRDSDEWGGSFLLLPEMMRTWYGKQGLIAEHYDAMKRYIAYLGTKSKDDIVSNGLGDWDGAGTDPRTPVGITDTAYYFQLTRTLATFAHSLGRETDAKKYSALAESIRGQFLAAFYDRLTGKVGTGSQSAQATALDFDMIDKQDQPRAFDQLMADIEAHKFAVSCGEVGHPALLRVLTKFGRPDVVAKIHLQTERPGYGYQIKLGLTSLTESWDAHLNSYNHFMLGHLMEWLYGDLAGIRPDPTGTAFSKIIIQPRPVPGVTWTDATYESARGRIECHWTIDGQRFKMKVLVPANTSATIYVPAKDGSAITVNYPTLKAPGITKIRGLLKGYAAVSVKSGSYRFESNLP